MKEMSLNLRVHALLVVLLVESGAKPAPDPQVGGGVVTQQHLFIEWLPWRCPTAPAGGAREPRLIRYEYEDR